jgi:hypothetical protein
MLFNVAAFALLPLVLSAPLLAPSTNTTTTGKYVVVLKPSKISALSLLSLVLKGPLKDILQQHTYELGDFKGFSATLTATQVKTLKALDLVRILQKQ